MNRTLIKAVKATLDNWMSLDDSHKGISFESAKINLENWLKNLENNEEK